MGSCGVSDRTNLAELSRAFCQGTRDDQDLAGWGRVGGYFRAFPTLFSAAKSYFWASWPHLTCSFQGRRLEQELLFKEQDKRAQP